MSFKVGDKVYPYGQTVDGVCTVIDTDGKGNYQIRYPDGMVSSMNWEDSELETVFEVANEESKFPESKLDVRVGDHVRIFGIQGIVADVNDYIDIDLVGGGGMLLRLDGTPVPGTETLTVTYRPKKKVAKTFKGWLNVLPNSVCPAIGAIYSTKSEADRYALPMRVACIEINETYEVEE